MRYSAIGLLLLGAALLSASEDTGTKMVVRTTLAGHASEQTTYWQGDRKRVEYRGSVGRRATDGSTQYEYGPASVFITRCDLGQIFQLNLDAAKYTSAPFPPVPLTKKQMEARAARQPGMPWPAKPTLRVERTTVDTGERKESFGHIARHVITTQKQTPLEGSHSQPQESVEDGWYIDLDQQLSCSPKWYAGARGYGFWLASSSGQPPERPEFVEIGKPEMGFAVEQVATSKLDYTLPDGTRNHLESKSEVVVTHLQEDPLDPTLFEVPRRFKHVDHLDQSATMPASGHPKTFWERLKARAAALFG